MAGLALNLASMLPSAIQTNKNLSTINASPQVTGGSTTTTSTTSGSGLDDTTTGTTFLNLLVKELQNQDPTAPMDSTQMVGQMISLNQLDQLISINQVLSNATGSGSSSSTATGGSTGALSSAAQMAQRTALINSTQNANAIQAATQSAADPNQTLNFSTLNMPYGGN